MTFSTWMPNFGMADFGLFLATMPHRSNVFLTPGKFIQFLSISGETWSRVSAALLKRDTFKAWTNAVSLAGEKSEGWRMALIIGILTAVVLGIHFLSHYLPSVKGVLNLPG
jgi:hypothetical protein